MTLTEKVYHALLAIQNEQGDPFDKGYAITINPVSSREIVLRVGLSPNSVYYALWALEAQRRICWYGLAPDGHHYYRAA